MAGAYRDVWGRDFWASELRVACIGGDADAVKVIMSGGVVDASGGHGGKSFVEWACVWDNVACLRELFSDARVRSTVAAYEVCIRCISEDCLGYLLDQRDVPPPQRCLYEVLGSEGSDRLVNLRLLLADNRVDPDAAAMRLAVRRATPRMLTVLLEDGRGPLSFGLVGQALCAFRWRSAYLLFAYITALGTAYGPTVVLDEWRPGGDGPRVGHEHEKVI